MIKDGYNRVHDYLRISLTDNCDLRCAYCMPEEDYTFTPHSRLVQAGEIEALAKVFVGMGVRKIRLTGGEPLVRKDAKEIILALSRLPVELTMTTNGTRLHDFSGVIRDAGIRSLNISLDTLQKDRFLLMTRRDKFDQVRRNIDLMWQQGIKVKVNVVIMKGVNDDEIIDFIQWTKDVPVHVRFIEFMPFSGNRWNNDTVVTWQQILEIASCKFDVQMLQPDQHATAKGYQVAGHLGTFAVISTMSAPFCSDCNRMRLTADGKMKNCLFSKSETDLLTPYRNGQDVEPLIRACIADKKQALGGQFIPVLALVDSAHIENRSMISIGG